MKKLIAKYLMWISVAVLAVIFLPKFEAEAACSHRWSAWVVEENATCSHAGAKHRTCSRCGKFEQQMIPKLSHSYGSWVTDRAATCTSSGTRHRSCVRCGTRENGTIASLGHSWKGWVTVEQPTCVYAGTKNNECSRCGKMETQRISATGHNMGSWQVTQSVNCKQDGIETRSCRNSNCGYKETRVYATKTNNHSWGSWVTEEAATCTRDGAKHRNCTVCGKFEQARIIATGHNMGSWHVTQTVNCKQDGIEARSCNNPNCGLTETRVYATKTNNHSWGAWVVEEAATCAYEGAQHRSCAVCGRMEQARIPKPAHVFAAATCTEPETCVNCGTTRGSALGHNWGSWVIEEEATCAYEGAKHRVCARCNKMEQAKISKPAHDYAPATCTKPQTCRNCGLTQGEKLPHAWENKGIVQQLDCKHDRIERFYCPMCKTTEDRVTEHTTGHIYMDGYHFPHVYIDCGETETEVNFYCMRCGETSEIYTREEMDELGIGHTDTHNLYYYEDAHAWMEPYRHFLRCSCGEHWLMEDHCTDNNHVLNAYSVRVTKGSEGTNYVVCTVECTVCHRSSTFTLVETLEKTKSVTDIVIDIIGTAWDFVPLVGDFVEYAEEFKDILDSIGTIQDICAQVEAVGSCIREIKQHMTDAELAEYSDQLAQMEAIYQKMKNVHIEGVKSNTIAEIVELVNNGTLVIGK